MCVTLASCCSAIEEDGSSCEETSENGDDSNSSSSEDLNATPSKLAVGEGMRNEDSHGDLCGRME